MDEAEDNDIYGGGTIASIDDPVILLIELGHVTNSRPGAGIIPTMPYAIDLDVC
jgi:hypothetical protein